MRPDRQPAPVVPGRDHAYQEVADASLVAGCHLVHPEVGEPAHARHLAWSAPGHEQARARLEPGQRGNVQVVGVQMGDEGHVRTPGAGRRYSTAAPAQMGETAGEQRVGEHTYVRIRHRAGGVAPPGDLHRHLFASFARLPEAYGLE